MDARISIAMCANSLDVNGISTVIMNYCNNLSLQKFKITLLAGSPIADQYRKNCARLGIDIVELPPRKTSSRSYYAALSKALQQLKPDVFHVHGNSATITIELFLAWKAGIKVRIAHSHNTTCANMKLHKALYPLFQRLYTDAFACGEQAGRWLFRDGDFTVLPNGFDTERFQYNESQRTLTRKKLSCEDSFVIGHMGRFNEQKNQPFLLDVFEKAAEINEKAVLLLIGTGPDFEKTKSLVDRHPYRNRILLYGETDDPVSMYMAMDVFCLPSKYEGLPVVLLEAQIAGLPCVVSDQVTREVDFGDVVWRSLEEAPEKWANSILTIEHLDRKHYHLMHRDEIERYQISDNVRQLEQLYQGSVERKGIHGAFGSKS